MNNFYYDKNSIKLSVIPPESWRMNSGVRLEDSKDWKNIRLSILKKYDFTCGFCGFRSLKYMEVHHKNGIWWNDSIENLVPVCPLCHSCFHIGLAGTMKNGILVEMSSFIRQEDISFFCLKSASEYKKESVKTIALFYSELPVVKNFGSEGLIHMANKLLLKSKQLDKPGTAHPKYRFLPDMEKYNIYNYLCD